MIEADERLGTVRRKTPSSTWSALNLMGQSTRRAGLLDTSAAAAFLAARSSTVDKLRLEFGELERRRFDIFGTRAPVESWHSDPITGSKYCPDRHWSRVKEKSTDDLKLVWEPSRFGWAYSLARLHVADSTVGAAALFWELFEEWCAENQPNCGVNWKCGQESSIRLMAVVFAVDVFAGESETPLRAQRLAAFADVTARRVLAHWRYAKHQRNNHTVSEAVGLLTVACVFPELDIADKAGRVGRRLLVDACNELVFEDGGTSQYSVNYHRVFLHNFLWAKTMLRACRQSISVLDEAIERSANFLYKITDPATGQTANFGANDGALLLPLADAHFNDMRPTLRAAGVDIDQGEDNSSELAIWLGAGPRPSPPSGRHTRSGTTHFSNMGVSVLEHDGNRAVVRGTAFRTRPSHSDQLHVDLWIGGTHVVVDPGTYSYKPLKDVPDLSLSRFHNGPITDNREDMRRVSRFLVVDWSTVSVDPFDPANTRWSGRRRSPHTKTEVRRIVEPCERGWSITDEVLGGDAQRLSAAWLLPTEEVAVHNHQIRFTIEGSRFAAYTASQASAESGVTISAAPAISCRHYRNSTPATMVTFEVPASSGLKAKFVSLD